MPTVSAGQSSAPQTLREPAAQTPPAAGSQASETLGVAGFAVAEVEADVTHLGEAVLPYVAKAVAEATPVGAVHLAIGPGGPVIRDAGDLGLVGLTRRLSELGPGTDPGGATLTLVVSGLAAETVPPEPGQAGTLVVGQVLERPAVVRPAGGGAGISVRSFVRLVFSYDHRVLRRDDAARFLTAVKNRLEAPWTSAV
jgi:pyruvate dehydrogenase E2 component (dihydrolipoamide acetyltransferase)